MIELHLINDTPIVLNSDLIEFIEATPDTMICLQSGKKMLVKERVSEVVDRIVEFRHKVAAGSSQGALRVGTCEKPELRKRIAD